MTSFAFGGPYMPSPSHLDVQVFEIVFVFLVLVQDSVDYQGRSYLHIPQDIDVRLDTDEPPERCYLPKKHIHTWSVKAPSYYFLCYQKDD